MFDILKRNWWAYAIQGLGAVIFGILTLVWPRLGLAVMIALFGAFAVVIGATLVAASFDAARRRLHWGSLLATGILSLIAGLVTWFWPGLTALGALYLVVAWAVMTGILYIVASVELREFVPHTWLMAFSGVLSLVLALVLAVDPRDGILSLVLVIGSYSIIAGIAALVFAFRLRNLHEHIARVVPRLTGSVRSARLGPAHE